MKFLNFQIEELSYGVPLEKVKEVIAFPEFTAIPGLVPHCLGIMNLRDQIIPLIDLRIKFKIEPTLTHDTSIVVCDVDGTSIGLVVDVINNVVAPEGSELLGMPPGSVASTNSKELVLQVVRKDGKLILILNTNSLVDQNEIDLKSITSAFQGSEKKAA